MTSLKWWPFGSKLDKAARGSPQALDTGLGRVLTPGPFQATGSAGPGACAAGLDDPAEQLRQFQSWVYAAVHAIAQEVARQKPLAWRDVLGAAPRERLPPEHPLCRLLDRPNPWTTAWELWYLTAAYLELTGNCFWYVATDDAGSPVELWVIPTPWVRVVPDARTFVRHYEVRAESFHPERFSPAEIVHLKYPNPADPHWGLSPVRANALVIDANAELLKSRRQTFATGPRPGVMLQTDQILSDQTVTRLEEKLEDKFAGRRNWHRPLVLEQGLKASPWTLSPAEMDFTNSARLTREEILAVYRVPAAVTGLLDVAGLGQGLWEGARMIFCEGTIQPKLDLIAQSLTRDLAARFGPDVSVEFGDCSPRLGQLKREAEAEDLRLGVRTVAEVRAARGLPPLGG